MRQGSVTAGGLRVQSIQFRPEQFEQIKGMSTARHIPFAQVVRELVDESLARRASARPARKAS